MGSGYRPPRDILQLIQGLQRQIDQLRAAAGVKSAVIYDPDTGSRIRLGDGEIAFWDNYDLYPSTFGRLYCDPGAGLNLLRMFPPYAEGDGVTNSLTIQGTSSSGPGNAWIYTDGQLLLSADETLFVDAGQVQVLTGGEFGLYELPTTSSSSNLFLGTVGGVFTVALVTSSRRYKQDIVDFTPDPEQVLAWRPRKWRDKTEVAAVGDDAVEQYGFIAEEIAELTPEMVAFDDEGRPDALKYDRMVTGHQVVLQRQAQQIADLQAQNAALAARLDALEAGAQ